MASGQYGVQAKLKGGSEKLPLLFWLESALTGGGVASPEGDSVQSSSLTRHFRAGLSQWRRFATGALVGRFWTERAAALGAGSPLPCRMGLLYKDVHDSAGEISKD